MGSAIIRSTFNCCERYVMFQAIYHVDPPDDDSNPGPDTGNGDPPPKPPGK